MMDIFKISPFKSILRGDRVVIYGAGKWGQILKKIFLQSNHAMLVAILDQNWKNISKKIYYDNKVPLLSPYMISKLEFDYIIVANENELIRDEIREFVVSQGVDEQKIICPIFNEVQVSLLELTKFYGRNILSDKPSAFIFMLPEHGNLGDYVIGYSVEKIINEIFPKMTLITVTTNEWISGKNKIISLIKKEDVIMFNGGGYWGSLRGNDMILKDMVDAFPENKKLFFPNTLTYKNTPNKDNDSFMKDMKWVCDKSNIFNMFRDPKSYQVFSEFDNRSALYPDMAFYYSFSNKKELTTNKPRILLILRNDCEKVFSKNEELKGILLSLGLDYEEFDLAQNCYVSQEDGRNLFESVVVYMQKFDCIVTDRLHGMILSVISNLPCIVFDSYTKKISEVYNKWVHDKESTVLLGEGSVASIDTYIYAVINNKIKNGEYTVPKEHFDNMKSFLKDYLKG